jgi:hypothetical protein
MDTRYEQFCLVDRLFYDSPERAGAGVAGSGGARFLAGRAVPAGWTAHDREGWTHLVPPDTGLPPQGWKIHVSATLDNAARLLDTVWDYCPPRRLAFKFLADRTTLLLRNAKYADRSGSGKFVTLYPLTAADFERTLRELGDLLAGEPGPYVLNDLRWQDGPLYFRYGAFRRRYCRTADGELVPAVADPDGRLVPDIRAPYFEVPRWAQVPAFIAAQVSARLAEQAAPADFPFRIDRPLHFSNGGGIYLATDTRSGRQVVLREARPFAGLDASGRDAVYRLGREREFLAKLAGTGVVPELYEHFTCWDHHFLAQEYVEGKTLGRAFVTRYPLIHPEASEQAVAEYTGWALDVLDRIGRGLRVMHDHGIAYGDLHPHNVIVRPDGEIRFVDLELASYLTEEQPPALGAPGFVPGDGRRGADVDRYALACLRVSMFVPLTPLLPLDPATAEALVRTVTTHFPVPPAYAAEVLRELRPRTPAGGAGAGGPGADGAGADGAGADGSGADGSGAGGSRRRVPALAAGMGAGEADWPALHASMCRAILDSATPEREDRLFPGDINQFLVNGLGIAYGAAGVLYALAGAGAGRFPEHERWLLAAARRGGPEQRVGLYDGLHGIAYVLHALGRPGDALSVLDMALSTPLDELSTSLFSGLPGVGLSLLHFAAVTGDATLRARALEAAERLVNADRAGPGRIPDGPAERRPRAGLLNGPSGHALFYLRLHRATGEGQFLDLAGTALRCDLDNVVTGADGTVQMDEGWRTMPYLASGSAGLGLVLHEYLAHRHDDGFATALAGIRRAAEPEFIIGSGLFNGRAGLIAFLARLRDTSPSGPVELQPVIDRHLRRLAWHIVSYRDEIAFPGDQLLRLSMDLATGSAGILLAVRAAQGKGRAWLPFLDPTDPPATVTPDRGGRR